MASEMLYPVMPVWLKQVGFSALAIGLLEGIAEAIAGLSKGWFGHWSDRAGRRLPFVQAGYSLSALIKPLYAWVLHPAGIFLLRSADRLGKGIRTAPRDALLVADSTPEYRGRVFGFHRSMDTLGAALGPLLALIYLYFRPGDFKGLFLVAFIPGALAVLASFLAREKIQPVAKTEYAPRQGFIQWLRNAPSAYYRICIPLWLFALWNSSDVFLLLRLGDAGFSATEIIVIYIGYNLIYTLAAWPAGILSDRIGNKKVLLAGFVIFAFVYIGFGMDLPAWGYIICMGLYGLYMAGTEGIAKAWISHTVPSAQSASAIGSFAGIQSVLAIPAGLITGGLWAVGGPGLAFVPIACVAVLCAVWLLQPATKYSR
ncbi:MAG: MFS transporter [Bacteroidetes bacterium]|nr:MFS transporter [Bacteroidota bacterium]